MRSVLIVEADPERQVDLARLLGHQGHRVVATSSFAGAHATLAEWSVDLVLIRQELPGATGVDMARQLRMYHPTAPVVIASSEALDGVRRAARRVGALGCVASPVSAEALAPWLSPEQSAAAVAVPAE